MLVKLHSHVGHGVFSFLLVRDSDDNLAAFGQRDSSRCIARRANQFHRRVVEPHCSSDDSLFAVVGRVAKHSSARVDCASVDVREWNISSIHESGSREIVSAFSV
jgi:hypothetical protein